MAASSFCYSKIPISDLNMQLPLVLGAQRENLKTSAILHLCDAELIVHCFVLAVCSHGGSHHHPLILF